MVEYGVPLLPNGYVLLQLTNSMSCTMHAVIEIRSMPFRLCASSVIASYVRFFSGLAGQFLHHFIKSNRMPYEFISIINLLL